MDSEVSLVCILCSSLFLEPRGKSVGHRLIGQSSFMLALVNYFQLSEGEPDERE